MGSHLVLGSRGQIGAHLVGRLWARGESVREIDLVLGNDHDLRRQDAPLLADCVDECDVVHFLAFDVGGSIYLEKYQDTFAFISNNVKIMDRVFDVLARTRKPFLFASSQMSNLGHSTYGRLKSIGESYTRALGGVVLQFWNVFGWEPDPEKSHVVTDFIRMARDDGRIAMRTDGSEERQFLYGDDCADCLIELSARYASIDRDCALHVASFEWTSIRRIARIISARFGNCPISAGSRADTVQRSTRIEPDPYVLQFWRPATPLQEGIDSGREANARRPRRLRRSRVGTAGPCPAMTTFGNPRHLPALTPGSSPVGPLGARVTARRLVRAGVTRPTRSACRSGRSKPACPRKPDRVRQCAVRSI